MKRSLKKDLSVIALIIVVILTLSSTALAFSLPEFIYYEIENGGLVMTDYKKAVEGWQDGNPVLRNALRIKLVSALLNGDVFVEAEDGTVIDWDKALTKSYDYGQAYLDNTVHVGPRNPVRELIINPLTGLAEEFILARLDSVTAVNGTVTAVLDIAPATTPVIRDFQITQSINGGAATIVNPTAIVWSLTTRKASLTVAQVVYRNVDQSVVMTAVYKKSPPKSAPPFVVPGIFSENE
jgi:hypothetical protein